MVKMKLDDGDFGYPMPVTLVGATVDGKPNFMAVAWVSRVNYSPTYLAIAIGRKHHTTRGIEEHGTFSVNLPGRDLVVPTDYVGIYSGAEVDKAEIFDVFYGELETAPMAEGCPLCAEYRVAHKLELPGDYLYVTGPVDFTVKTTVNAAGVFSVDGGYRGVISAQPLDMSTGEPVPAGDPFTANVDGWHRGLMGARNAMISARDNRLTHEAGGAQMLVEFLQVPQHGRKTYTARIRCFDAE